MPMITTASGATKTLPEGIDPAKVAGLDRAGRIVVDDYNARQADPHAAYTMSNRPTPFGLTLCCNTYDKGSMGGVVCRNCYGDAESGADIGAYLPLTPDGFVGLDPVVSIA